MKGISAAILIRHLMARPTAAPRSTPTRTSWSRRLMGRRAAVRTSGTA